MMFFIPKLVDIEPGLLEVFEGVIEVRFLRQSIVHKRFPMRCSVEISKEKRGSILNSV